MLYIALFFWFWVLSNIYLVSNEFRAKYSRVLFYISMLILLFIIAFRYQVGADWEAYVDRMDDLRGESIFDAYMQDMLYGVIDWLGANIFKNIYFVNFTSTLIIIYFSYKFLLFIPNYWMGALILLQPYFIYIAMNQIRQGVAIVIIAYAIMLLSKSSKILMPIFLMFLAINFHISAILICLILIIYIIAKSQKKLLFGFFISLPILFFIYSSYEYVTDKLVFYSFVTIDNAASFFLLRILFCIFAASIIIWRFFRGSNSHKIISFYAISIIFIPLLFIQFPSGIVFIERLSSFWIPLQAIAFSDFNFKNKLNNIILINIFSFIYFIIFLIWVNFSSVSEFWIPYRNILLE